MTDTATMFKIIVANTQTFIAAWEQMRLIADRIGADTSLSSKLASSANASGRTDLTTADFDNLNAAIGSLTTRFNTADPNVNAATVKLPFYTVV